jgi:hypothetical protein
MPYSINEISLNAGPASVQNNIYTAEEGRKIDFFREKRIILPQKEGLFALNWRNAPNSPTSLAATHRGARRDYSCTNTRLFPSTIMS